jgi:inositol transport system ATP-binding protein
MNPQSTSSILTLQGITKRFGTVTVLDGVNLEVRAGEIHALVGENGAGKSTLMNIIGGVHAADSGTIDFAGHRDVRLADAHAAQVSGIATVYQERSLFPHLSVAENIFAGRQPTSRAGKIDRRRMATEARGILERIGVHLSPWIQVAELSPDQQQMVEVAKALSLGAKLLILDEPTAALTETETAALFRVVRQLRTDGVGIIYISHRLEEVFHLADRVTVLKDGRLEGTFEVRAVTPAILVQKMIGRDLLASPREKRSRGAPLLEVNHLSDAAARSQERTWLRDVSFSVHGGELVGFAGLAGAGRTELALSIIGARRGTTGEIRVAGKRVEIKSPADAIREGIGYLPEERKSDGLFADLDLVENSIVAGLSRFGTWWMNRRAADKFFQEMRTRLHVSCRDPRQPIIELSGGNQQKCLLARWLLVRPNVLILDEPTRGVDVAAKSEVHRLLHELRQQGTAVIVISSDLPEILAVSDRIIVMRQGRIAGELPGTASEEDVMKLASLELTAA